MLFSYKTFKKIKIDTASSNVIEKFFSRKLFEACRPKSFIQIFFVRLVKLFSSNNKSRPVGLCYKAFLHYKFDLPHSNLKNIERSRMSYISMIV